MKVAQRGYSVLDGVYSSRYKFYQNGSTKKDDTHQYTTETSLKKDTTSH